MYEFYFNEVRLPVAPEQLDMKIGNQNKTMVLMNGSEINLLKSPSLTEIEFEFLLPTAYYPFTSFAGPEDFLPASYYLDWLEEHKAGKSPFQFKVLRKFPNGTELFNTDIKVSLEEYTITESADNGFDLMVSVTLKQYRDYGTKVGVVNREEGSLLVTWENHRPVSDNVPVVAGKELVVAAGKGETLWGLCKNYLGNGSLYSIVAKENNISNPNRLSPGQKIRLTANVTDRVLRE